MTKRHSIKLAGFTLVELLVVVGIVLLLAGFLLAGFNSARNKSQMTSCASNLHQIYLACALYANDNGGLLPDYTSQMTTFTATGSSVPVHVEQSQLLVSSLYSYLHTNSVWRCPGDHRPPHIGTGTAIFADGTTASWTASTSYAYGGRVIGKQGIQPISLDVSNSRELIEDDATCAADEQYPLYNHQGLWNCAYFDGHSKPFIWDCSNPNHIHKR